MNIKDSTDPLVVKKVADLSLSIMKQIEKLVALNPPGIDLTVNQYRILWYLHSKNKAMVGEFTKILHAANSTTSEIISRMEEIGLIKKEKDPKDHRKVIVELTKKGKKIITKKYNYQKKIFKTILSYLTPKQQKEFLGSLEKLNKLIESAILASKVPQTYSTKQIKEKNYAFSFRR